MPAWYRASVQELLDADEDRIFGALLSAGYDTSLERQRQAWRAELRLLRAGLHELSKTNREAAAWGVLLEYPIPRRPHRIDTVVLAGQVIFVVEFKIGSDLYSGAAKLQVEDYALDLRDFHRESQGRTIQPLLVATAAPSTDHCFSPTADPVQPVYSVNAQELAPAMHSLIDLLQPDRAIVAQIDLRAWDEAVYAPVPTIIEAATTLYAKHDVQEIAHSYAGAHNLTTTRACVLEAIRTAREGHKKVICFITGVPGAGKTLAGLNIAAGEYFAGTDAPPTVFLSGNGPLVKVVSAALVADHRTRTGATTSESQRAVGSLIQNVHVFTEEYAQRLQHEPPIERVVIFDEAQRAWDAAQVVRSARTSRRGPGEIPVIDSEPHQMLEIMDRHLDWSVIVALVGGGQEIHTGEAGLAEWGSALTSEFSHWEVFASPEALRGGDSVAGSVLFPEVEGGNSPLVNVKAVPALHLELSLRSFRASAVTQWVNATLAGDAGRAADVARTLAGFPIYLTRSLDTLRRWLRVEARGLRRPGLVASSGALRHRAYGIELSQSFRSDFPYEQWFLASPDDVRSSHQLEVAATEFECQGLELDFVGLCWGGDFVRDPAGGGWISRRFAANRWLIVQDDAAKQYLINKYRVLLTRAREGLVIWVPPGSATDPTLDPTYFDATYEYLSSCGLPEAPSD